jgi:hypothetical protein
MDAPRNAAVDCAENPARSRARTAASLLPYLAAGVLFGFVAIRSEIVSWYRIQEMFRFQSFHMYGVIGSAILLLGTGIYLIRRYHLKTVDGERIFIAPKAKTWTRYILGGTIFGLGWALTGACPGPVFALMGHGYSVLLVTFGSMMLGTFTYGLLRHKLPHG